MKEILERLKSPVVVMGVLCQIAIIISIFNQDFSDTFKAIMTPFVEILTLIGLLNNPSDKEGF